MSAWTQISPADIPPSRPGNNRIPGRADWWDALLNGQGPVFVEGLDPRQPHGGNRHALAAERGYRIRTRVMDYRGRHGAAVWLESE